MASYIAAARIVVGAPGGRTVIEPGETFDPAVAGISDQEIAAMLAASPEQIREVPPSSAGGETGGGPASMSAGEGTVSREQPADPAEGL